MEVSVSEKAALVAPQPHSCRQSWWSGPQRRLMVILENCTIRWHNQQHALFPLYLMAFFLAILTLGVIRILFELSITRISAPYCSWRSAAEEIYKMWTSLHRKGIMFLAVFTAVFAIRVLMKMRKKCAASSSHQIEEVKTISGLIQQV